ncbi:MAG TPA: hypothetical protein VLJ21_00765 [Candidatus Binatia bacterium]|nr:hypothetical protein [Candidatus Binatia bacterium]
MTLVISTCAEELSELEFVRPLTELLGCKAKHYRSVTQKDLEKADCIVISGTALKDFAYLDADWSWLKTIDKPVLGICAGMQVIAKAFGISLKDHTVIGPRRVEVVAENSLIEGECEAYFLHTKTGIGHFRVLAKSEGTPCIIKHPEKEVYGVIFHPEVMNEEILEAFLQ